jgi:probable rRNA maturation factor
MSQICGLNLPLLRRIARRLADEIFPRRSHEIGVYFASRKEITKLNERFLGHEGPTDVITFDYGGHMLHGEIFICPSEAVIQAKEFGTTPQMELVRYVVHGLLHLRGYDDRTPAQQKKMKRAEDSWVRWAADEFPCEKVWSRKPRA